MESGATGRVKLESEVGGEAQSVWVVAELPPLESITEWKEAGTRLRELVLQLAPLEAATELQAEAERRGAFAEELRRQSQTQHDAVSEREGLELVRSWWRQQSAFLRPCHRGRTDT